MAHILVIMLHYGSKSITKQTLESLRSKIGSHQLALINNSTEDILDLAKIIPNTKLINNKKNLGFAKSVNLGLNYGLKNSQYTHFLLLNNDVTFSYGSIDQLLIGLNKCKTLGAISPVLRHSGGYDWGGKYNKWTGMVKHKNWENKPKTMQVVDHLAAAALLIPRQIVEQVGLFDERFFLYYEDLDYSLRLRAQGYSLNIFPDVVVEHQVSASSSGIDKFFHSWRSHLQFLLKYLPFRAYPTALIYDSLFYPLLLLKLALTGKLK